MDKFTTVSEVERIAAMKDPVQRNYHITQSYHELSQLMARRTGNVANWCTFATWASKQAGCSIRKEDLLHALENRVIHDSTLSESLFELANRALEKGVRLGKQGIQKLIWDTLDPKAAMLRASDAVARGNQKVYAEIGREFARFIETCLADGAYDPGKIKQFCASLRSGEPPNGQQYLQQAFSRYYAAFFETDEKRMAELLLLANIEIGFHEQARLQPEIAEALEASVTDPKLFKQKLLRTLFPNQNWLSEVGSLFSAFFKAPTPLDTAIDNFTAKAKQRLRSFLTARLMELEFPNGQHLRLGKDLSATIPVKLKELENPELLALLARIDPTPNSLSGSGTEDWANLQDRLHFIADLFRCYQETRTLLSPPFEEPLPFGE